MVISLQASTSCSPPPRTLPPNRTPLFYSDQGHQKGRSPLLPSSRSNKKPWLLMDSYGHDVAGLRYGEESLAQEWGGTSSSNTPARRQVSAACIARAGRAFQRWPSIQAQTSSKAPSAFAAAPTVLADFHQMKQRAQHLQTVRSAGI